MMEWRWRCFTREEKFPLSSQIPDANWPTKPPFSAPKDPLKYNEGNYPNDIITLPQMCAPFEKSRKIVTPKNTFEYPLPKGAKHNFVYSEYMGGNYLINEH